ncbi:unnamed protein product, partial [Cylindrotheca closterium]
MADTKPKAKTTSSHISFPRRVYNVLKFCKENDHEHIASWMNDGTAFRVHDIEEFESELLPKYFNTRKYSSFTRALCAHGFDCIRTGSHTGIYSHPKFNRNDPETVSLMKRVKKAKTVKNKRISSGGRGSLFRDGEQSVLRESLSARNRPHTNLDENASVFGQGFQSVRSQIADRATYALIRLPPASHFVSSDESDNDSSEEPHTPPVSAVPSSSNHMASDYYNGTILDQQEQIDENFGSIFDDNDFEPIPLPLHTTSQNFGIPYHSEDDDASLSSLEPRNIQEMKRNPEDFNAFYIILPVFPKPRYQALYDFSSPVALPALFHYMDISTFGMCWAMFLIVGHTIQA